MRTYGIGGVAFALMGTGGALSSVSSDGGKSEPASPGSPITPEGIDTIPYGNRCEAAAAGASIESEGECGPPIVQVGDSSPLAPRPRSGVH